MSKVRVMVIPPSNLQMDLRLNESFLEDKELGAKIDAGLEAKIDAGPGKDHRKIKWLSNCRFIIGKFPNG